MSQASLGDGHRVAPTAGAGPAKPLIPASTLTQNFNNALSDIVSVKHARRVALWVKYTPDESATGGYPIIVVLLSAAADKPALGDDLWYPATELDATPTDADLSGNTVPTGADWTEAPEWREIKGGPIVLRTFAADGTASEVVRCKFAIDVTDARWMYVAAVEAGDPSNAGVLTIDWSVSL